jgi:hypothetical protein
VAVIVDVDVLVFVPPVFLPALALFPRRHSGLA